MKVIWRGQLGYRDYFRVKLVDSLLLKSKVEIFYNYSPRAIPVGATSLTVWGLNTARIYDGFIWGPLNFVYVLDDNGQPRVIINQ